MPMAKADAELRSICTLDKHRMCAVADHPPSPRSSLRWLDICAASTVASWPAHVREGVFQDRLY